MTMFSEEKYNTYLFYTVIPNVKPNLKRIRTIIALDGRVTTYERFFLSAVSFVLFILCSKRKMCVCRGKKIIFLVFARTVSHYTNGVLVNLAMVSFLSSQSPLENVLF